MAWKCGGSTNAELVGNLKNAKIIRTASVETAMSRVDRGAYYKGAGAYDDAPQRIGSNVTISAPHMHAHALELLAPALAKPRARALDVGCGSGYLTAALGVMVGSEGVAVGIDHIEELVANSHNAVAADDARLLASSEPSGPVEFHVADGFDGWPDAAPYDVIHVGAAAPRMPAPLVAQLAPGGLLICPVGPDGGAQQLVQLEKAAADGQITQTDLMGVRYVPLTSKAQQLGQGNFGTRRM